jgi:Zn-dependent protease with chaperone function
MIEIGSIVGFALVFIATTWAISALLSGWLARSAARLRQVGPRAERRAASIALALPVAIGAALTAILIGFSLLGPTFGTLDHCAAHLEHLHLCIRHGAEWLSRWWATALAASVAALVVVRIAHAAHDSWTARRHLHSLRAVSSERILGDGTRVICAPSPRPFCFTAGLWAPRIYISTTTLDQLDAPQQRAVLAHERAHVAFGDLWRSRVLSILALLGAPVLAAATLRAWHRASERLCDRVAADELDSPATVAEALLAFARAPASPMRCSFVHEPDQIAERIQAVLGNADTGERAARRLRAVAISAFLLLSCAAVALVHPLHHTFELALGSL